MVIRDQGGDILVKEGRYRSHLKEFVTPYSVPCCYDPTAEAPVFQALMERMLPDVEQRQLWLEFHSDILVPSYNRFKRFMVTWGPPNTGKSKASLAVQWLMPGGYSTMSLQRLGPEVRTYRTRRKVG